MPKETSLSGEQLDALRQESQPDASSQSLFDELSAALGRGANASARWQNSDLEQPRSVGKKALPTTLGGLLVHVADHTQRHVGQAITTAKILLAERLLINKRHSIFRSIVIPTEFGYTPPSGGGVAARSGRDHNPVSQRAVSHRQSAGRQSYFSRADARIFSGITSPVCRSASRSIVLFCWSFRA